MIGVEDITEVSDEELIRKAKLHQARAQRYSTNRDPLGTYTHWVEALSLELEIRGIKFGI